MPRFKLLTVILLLLASLLQGADAQEIIDGIAAVVNGDVITFSQVRELVGAREKALRDSLRGEQLVAKIKEVREEALKDLIDRQLILQEFKKQGLTLPDYAVEEQVQTIIREEFGGDRAAFQRTLQAQGYSLSRFKEIERDKIIVQAMRRKALQSKTILPPGKIEEYYKEHRDAFTTEAKMKLRMIVLQKSGGESPEAQVRMAEEIRAKIVGGAEFEKMAELYSEDSTSVTGGDWGWIDSRTLNSELSGAAFKLEPGRVSQVVEFGDSIYLLYCEAKKNASVKAFKEVRDDIEAKLTQEDRQQAQEKWLESLRKKAYVKKY